MDDGGSMTAATGPMLDAVIALRSQRPGRIMMVVGVTERIESNDDYTRADE